MTRPRDLRARVLPPPPPVGMTGTVVVAAALGAPVGYLGALGARRAGLHIASAAAPGHAALVLATGNAALFGLLGALQRQRGAEAGDALEVGWWGYAAAQALAGPVGAAILQAVSGDASASPLEAAAVGVAGVAAGLVCAAPLFGAAWLLRRPEPPRRARAAAG